MPRTAAKENENVIRIVSTITITDQEQANLLFYYGTEKSKLKKLLEELQQSNLVDLTIANSTTVEVMRNQFLNSREESKKIDLTKPTDKKEEKAA